MIMVPQTRELSSNILEDVY